MTEFSQQELVHRAGRFGGRLKERIGGSVVVTVAVVPPDDAGAHILDGDTLASWPIGNDHTARTAVATLTVWLDPVGTADQVADAVERGVGAAMSSMGREG